MTEKRQADAGSSLSAAKGIVSEEKIKKAVSGVTGDEQETGNQEQSAQTETGKEGTQGRGTEEATKKTEESAKEGGETEEGKTVESQQKEAKKTESIEIDTPLGKTKIGEEEAFDTIEDVKKFAKDYGFEINSLDDFKDVFDKYKELQKQIGEYQEYKNKALQYDNIFSSFPEEVSAVVYSYLNGEDYKEVLKNITSPIDYNKNFDDHDKLNLVNHYTENNFDNETWNGLDENVKSSLINAARKAYSRDQEKYKEALNAPQENAKELQRKFQESVDQSITQLRHDYPDMDDRQVERVRRLMVRDLYTTLYNDDGTYRPEAAKKIAMAEFGESTINKFQHTIKDIVQMYKNQGENKATERMVSRSDKPSDESGRNVQDRSKHIQEEVKRKTEFLKKNKS